VRTYRTALVTGASSGIGAAFVRALAEQGTAVVLVARRVERLEQTAEHLGREFGLPSQIMAADLTDPAELARVEARLADPEDPIDLLVNNAGLGGRGRLLDQPVDRLDREIRLNVLALLRLTKAALPGMLARRHGGVLNVSSVAGFQPMPGDATYAASKAFVTSFTESLAGELHGSGVRAMALCPGYTRTEFHGGDDSGRGPDGLWLDADRVARDALADLGRGRVISVPGRLWKGISLASRVSPRPLVRSVTRRLNGPG
jgi:uncharacterized protein